MKKTLVSLFLLLFVAVSASAQIDKIVGKWKTVDDKDGSEKSIVTIYKASNGKYYGKIEKVFGPQDARCDNCEGDFRGKPILGLVIMNDMVEKDGALTGGTILEPISGKIYRCNISYDEKSGRLKVRGSFDKRGVIGRTQYWVKP